MMNSTAPKIVIVGGSLAGLTLALACATRGIPVRVVERSLKRVEGGDSLTVNLSALAATVNHDPRVDPVLPVVPAYRDLTTWSALYSWLYERTANISSIRLDEGTTVTSVGETDGRVKLSFADGTETFADAVIGADGYNSTVRRVIAPDAQLARYAGYVVWRGLVDEQILKRPVPWPSDGGLWIDLVGGYRLVAAVLPGRDGSVAVGQRRITFAWFDIHRESLLHRTRRLTPDGHVVGTIRRGKIDADVRANLLSLVPQVWPGTWAEAVGAGVALQRVMSGAPIAEYNPRRLARGAIAIVGDAAHAVSPMTGRGFATAVDDAALLARMLAARPAYEAISVTLARYDAHRLPFIQGLVRHSSMLSTDYVRYARSA